MVLMADAILDRMKLKSQLQRWRFVAIAAVAFLAAMVFHPFGKHGVDGGLTHGLTSYIARIDIEGIIYENPHWQEVIGEIADDKSAKALLVYVNSPGGTLVGAENLFNELKYVRSKKPVVVIMGDYAASGGYWVSIAADRIFAREGTMTGSIGVIMQTPEVTGLIDKIGIKMYTFKSSELKGSPSPFEKMTPQVEHAVNDMILDAYNIFVEHVAQSRNFSIEETKKLADGRVYSGRQAVKLKLVDAIGGQREAIEWLTKEKQIEATIDIKKVSLDEEKTVMDQLFSSMASAAGFNSQSLRSGLWAMLQ
ncbi:MAG: signal peptide peptidase SppA [Alphaproteobacteria bacterium]|nr:signal peptide peptidase SppA [Alphaproteobacteria bacterium]